MLNINNGVINEGYVSHKCTYEGKCPYGPMSKKRCLSPDKHGQYDPCVWVETHIRADDEYITDGE